MTDKRFSSLLVVITILAFSGTSFSQNITGEAALACLDRYCYVPRNLNRDSFPNYGTYEQVFYDRFNECLNRTQDTDCSTCQNFWKGNISLKLPLDCTRCANKCHEEILKLPEFNDQLPGSRKYADYIGQCRIDCYQDGTFLQTEQYDANVTGDVQGYTGCVNQLIFSGDYNLKTQAYKEYKICRQFTKQCQFANKVLAGKKPSDKFPLESFICYESCYPVELEESLQRYYIAEGEQCMKVNQSRVDPNITDPIPTQTFTYEQFQTCLDKNQLSCPPEANGTETTSCKALLGSFDQEVLNRRAQSQCDKDLTVIRSCLQDPKQNNFRFPKSCSDFYETAFDKDFPVFNEDKQGVFLPVYKDTLVACAKTARPPQVIPSVTPTEYQSCLKACNQCTDYICKELVDRQETCMRMNPSKQCEEALGASSKVTVTYAQVTCRHSCANTFTKEYGAYQSFVNTVKCQPQCFRAAQKKYFYYERITECVEGHIPNAFRNQIEQNAVQKLQACYNKVRQDKSICKGNETDFVDVACSSALERCTDDIEFPDDYTRFYDYIVSTYLSCVRQGNTLASTSLISGLSQLVENCTAAARTRYMPSASAEVDQYLFCVENSTDKVCTRSREVFSEQLATGVLANVPLEKVICAYSCRRDPAVPNNFSAYLNAYESCLVKEDRNPQFRNFNKSKLEACTTRQVPMKFSDPTLRDCYKKLTKQPACSENCSFDPQNFNRVQKQCYDCLFKYTQNNSDFKQNCSDPVFQQYVKLPFLDCHAIDNYPIPEDARPTIYDVDHCLQITCLNNQTQCDADPACKADYDKFDLCLNPTNDQSEQNQAFISAVEYYLRKQKSPENRHPTERLNTRMACSLEVGADSPAMKRIKCENNCALKGRVDSTELLDYTFKEVRECLTLQVPRLEFDANSWARYDACVLGDQERSCGFCRNLFPLNETASDDRPYYEVCQQCRIACTRLQVFTSPISPILNLECLNRGRIFLDLQKKLLQSTATVAEADACISSSAYLEFNKNCTDEVACSERRNSYLFRNETKILCENAIRLFGQMAADPKLRDTAVPFEMQACVYARQPLPSDNLNWKKLYAEMQSCYLFGVVGQTPLPPRLPHFYLTTQTNILQNCYIPDSSDTAARKAFDEYVFCLTEDTLYPPCKTCQEDFAQGLQRFVLAACVQCQQLCQQKVLRQNFVRDPKLDEYTFTCHYLAIAQKEYQASIALRQKLSGTKIGFQSQYDLARLRLLINPTTEEYRQFKNCTERLEQCRVAMRNFAALSDTAPVPLDLYLCHRTCIPENPNPTFDKIRLQLDVAYGQKTNVLPEGLVYRDVETRNFTEKDFKTCQKAANFMCASRSTDGGSCKQAVEYYQKKKPESKLLKTCEEDRKILRTINLAVTDPDLQLFPVSCALYWEEPVPRSISIQDFWVISLYLQPAAAGCAANAKAPKFESQLAASNSDFAQCVSERCPVCQDLTCLEAQRTYTDCQLKESEQTEQCKISMDYTFEANSSTQPFKDRPLSFTRVVCRESCFDTSGNKAFMETLACQQKCYLASQRATFTFSEVNFCFNQYFPQELHPSWTELDQFYRGFQQQILVKCEATCGRFIITSSNEELSQQVPYSCQACLNSLLDTERQTLLAQTNASANSTVQVFLQHIYPVYSSCANTATFQNPQVALRQTIEGQEACLARAKSECDKDAGCQKWLQDDQATVSTCKRLSSVCRRSARLERDSQNFKSLLTSHYETYVCEKLCSARTIDSTVKETKSAGEKYLKDVDACFLEGVAGEPRNTGPIVEACIKLTVPEPSATNQPVQSRYFAELKTCRDGCYNKTGSTESPYDCSLQCFKDKYAKWTEYREEFVVNYLEKINRCMRVGVLPIYEPDNIQVAQEKDCEAYECPDCNGNAQCESQRKKFEECLAPQNQSQYCKAAFERYSTLESNGGEAPYPHEMNACKDSCLPEGAFKASGAFQSLWNCRRGCTQRSYLKPVSTYATVKSCLGDLRETVTKDTDGAKDYDGYEKCYRGSEFPECKKCNRRDPTKNETKLVYDHCTRCHYQCVNKFRFEKFPEARTRITWCWANRTLSADAAELLKKGQAPFTYKTLQTCNMSNCMTPFPNAIDSTLADIYAIYLQCQRENENCKACFEDASADRSRPMTTRCQQCVIDCRETADKNFRNVTKVQEVDAYLSHFQKYVSDCQLQCTHFGSLQFLEDIRSTTDSVYHCRNDLVQKRKIVLQSKQPNFVYYENCTKSSQQCRMALELAKSSPGDDVYPYGLYQCYQSCRPPVKMTEEFKSSWEWEQYCFLKPQAQFPQNQFTLEQNVYCERANMPNCADSACLTRKSLYEKLQESLKECEACREYKKKNPRTKRSPFTEECKSCKLASLQTVRNTPNLEQNTIFSEITEQVIEQCAIHGYVRQIIYAKSQATLQSYDQCYNDLCKRYECSRSSQQELCEQNQISKQNVVNRSSQCAMAEEEMNYYTIYGSQNDPIPSAQAICHESTTISDTSLDFTYLQMQNCISFCISNYYVRPTIAPAPPKPVDPNVSTSHGFLQFLTLAIVLIISLLF